MAAALVHGRESNEMKIRRKISPSIHLHSHAIYRIKVSFG